MTWGLGVDEFWTHELDVDELIQPQAIDDVFGFVCIWKSKIKIVGFKKNKNRTLHNEVLRRDWRERVTWITKSTENVLN